MHRVEKLVSQIGAVSPTPQITSSFTSAGNPDDDVVIVSCLRTPIGRGMKGDFAKSYMEELLTPVVKATLDRTKIDPNILGDVVVGNVLGSSLQRCNQSRIACFMAGMPDKVPVNTVNRQCSSGLQAIANVASAIRAGFYDAGLAAGVEIMSETTPASFWDPLKAVNPDIFMCKQAKDCLMPMGITSENVAKNFGVTRQMQDELAAASHAKAAKAIKTGRFKAEIVPVTIEKLNKKTGRKEPKVIDTDGGVREGTTVQSLGKLKAAFVKGGTTTAGNASQVSDGAAVALVMTRRKAKALGLPILGVFRSFAAVGCPPEIMGIGPAVAIPEALKQAGLSVKDIDVWEINEAFASQAVYCIKKLGIDMAKVNPNGGAIALGHPLGMTGVRMTATLLHEMEKQKSKYGVVSMCIGSGMGAAAVFERE